MPLAVNTRFQCLHDLPDAKVRLASEPLHCFVVVLFLRGRCSMLTSVPLQSFSIREIDGTPHKITRCAGLYPKRTSQARPPEYLLKWCMPRSRGVLSPAHVR